MRIEYNDFNLDTVVRYFAKDFKPKDGIIYDFEYFIDPVKGKIIFKLVIKEDKK